MRNLYWHCALCIKEHGITEHCDTDMDMDMDMRLVWNRLPTKHQRV
jgi:hypothetical protein